MYVRKAVFARAVFICVLNVFLAVVGFKMLSNLFCERTKKMFYVYSVPEDLLYKDYNMRPETCPYSMYSAEIVTPELIRRHKKYHQSDIKKARYFVVPQFSTCFYHFCLKGENSTEMYCKHQTQDYVTAILDWVETTHDSWSNNAGRDHVFVFSWDQGSEILGTDTIIANRISSSIHLVHHGKRGTSDQNFDPLKDYVIPVYRDYSTLERLQKPAEKTIFAYFRGTFIENAGYGLGIRKHLKSLGQNIPERYFIKEGHSEFYWNEIQRSLFALCPPGWSLWSPRFYDAIAARSIPVLFGDQWILPFEDMVNYRAFVVTIGTNNIHDVDKILANITQKELALKLRALTENTKRFRYSDTPTEGDAIDSILEQIARRPYPGILLGRTENEFDSGPQEQDEDC